MLKYKFIGWTRHGNGKGDVSKYHLKEVCNSITSFAGGGSFKDSITGMARTAPHILIEYE
jgi:hypothetical protein